jgi:hypothetical protein
MRTLARFAIGALFLAVAAGAALAQAPIVVPDASPKASISQTIGLTDITISYHRPAVNKRKIWGGLVPYNETWRAGANENTTLTLSTPATIGGKQLPAGTYGLHMLPGEKDWSVMLSSVSTAWGSFSYDAKEDVVRFTVTPTTTPDSEERLEYRFEDPTDDSVKVVLNWEKLQIAFPITVDTKTVVMDSLNKQLRGLPRFGWQGWNQAANWAVTHDASLDQALDWSDHSINLARTFNNLRTRAAILEKKGDAKGAADLRAEALKIGNENDINLYGYTLLGQDKTDEAIAIFRKNVKDHPQSWNCYDSLGEALAKKGDKAGAIENYTKALNMVSDAANKKRITDILSKLKTA